MLSLSKYVRRKKGRKGKSKKLACRRKDKSTEYKERNQNSVFRRKRKRRETLRANSQYLKAEGYVMLSLSKYVRRKKERKGKRKKLACRRKDKSMKERSLDLQLNSHWSIAN
jgi:hypothetical protein